MPRFRNADEGCILRALVLGPIGELLLAVSIAHGANERGGNIFRRTITQRIEGNGIGNPGERIAPFRPGQYRPLIVQPQQVAKKNHYQQCSGTCRDSDLGARGCQCHALLRQCRPVGLRNKVTGGIRGYRATDIPLIGRFS